MWQSVDWQRRRFLLLGAGAATGALLPLSYAHAQAQREGSGAAPDLWLELTAAPRTVALRPGAETPVWSYQARVLHGDAASVQPLPGGATYLGPTLHLRRGQRVRIDFINHLPEPSIVNWHGLHVPADMMGLPRYQVAPGGRYRYEFTVLDRAGTYWYHAMSAGSTPEQVYFGLAGLVIVSDAEEGALALPRGADDLPLVIQDRDWGADNQFSYPGGGGPGADGQDAAGSGEASGMTGGMMSGGMMGQMMGGAGMMRGGMGAMMTRMMGFFGRSILVNGHPDAVLDVAARPCRLRVLNACNARTCKLAWSDGRPLTVIATDGGLLERPLQKDFIMLTPGQRIELWADFSGAAVGSERTLRSLAFSGSMMMQEMMGRMGDGMMAGAGDWAPLADGAAFDICRLRVARPAGTAPTTRLPERFPAMPHLRAEDAANRDAPRTFRVTMGHMQWGFNGRSFEMDQVGADEVVRLGTTEVWEFQNNRMMAHAIHLHGLQFLVLGRSHGPVGDVRAGYVDEGWVDTVLLMPGEHIRLLMQFKDFAGRYAYQCHMLEHAASGLMRAYEVR